MAGEDPKSLYRFRATEEDYNQLQKSAFTKWINKCLAEDDGTDRAEDLYTDLRDGTKLLALIRLFTGVKLPCERGSNIVHKKLNVRTVLDFLEDRKIKTDGIVADDLVKGNHKITLALVWMLILNFEVVQPKPALLEWAQSVTQDYEGVDVKNFTHSWKDGRAFCAIINKHRPDLLDYSSCDFGQPLDCLKRAFSVAEDKLNIMRLFEPIDVHVSHPPEELIVMYVSQLKKVFSEMDPVPPVDPEEYSVAYNELLQWISTRKELLVSRDYPETIEETQQLMDKFREQKEEEKEKEKTMQEIGAMEKELTEFQLRHKSDFQLLKFTELKDKWLQYLIICDSYESALKKHLEKLMDIEREKLKKVLCLCKRLDEKQQEIHSQIEAHLERCSCSEQFTVHHYCEHKDGQSMYMYMFKDSDRIYVDIPNKSVVLTVGGGYNTLNQYFTQHDPCQKTGSRQPFISIGQAQSILLEEVDVSSPRASRSRSQTVSSSRPSKLRQSRSPQPSARYHLQPSVLQPTQRSRSPQPPLQRSRSPQPPLQRSRSPQPPLQRSRSPRPPLQRSRSPHPPLQRSRSPQPSRFLQPSASSQQQKLSKSPQNC